jgi:hypothetical protein
VCIRVIVGEFEHMVENGMKKEKEKRRGGGGGGGGEREKGERIGQMIAFAK